MNIDQSPIGRTPRSNPATYTGVFDHIRDLFAMTNDAKVRGYNKGRFSFNVKGGRCEACKGDGIIQIGMSFLPDVYVPCEVCKGQRYTRETLEVKYKGKNIFEVLDMTVEDAYEFFRSIPKIEPILKVLKDVGLTYVKLGQPSTTLSGGEAQRIKLATYLSRKQTGRTLFILDEPTTGLHTHDVKKLIDIIARLGEKGNTIVVIEHNLDVIKCADYVIDLGPEGGDAGGTIIATGTPEQITKVKASHTGRFLKKALDWDKNEKTLLFLLTAMLCLAAAGCAKDALSGMDPDSALVTVDGEVVMTVRDFERSKKEQEISHKTKGTDLKKRQIFLKKKPGCASSPTMPRAMGSAQTRRF